MICPNPIFLKETRRMVPCGKCPICKRKRANEWIVRLNIEFKHALSCKFVTLTYDDEHLPVTTRGHPNLKKQDVVDFLNRLRQYAPYRYFLVGEYGDKSSRAHYHMLLFNFECFFDKNGKISYRQQQKTTEQFKYRSAADYAIQKAWSYGNALSEPLQGGAIYYMASYINDPSTQSQYKDTVPTFQLMSKSPPIGYQYYVDSEIKKWHNCPGMEKYQRFYVNLDGHKYLMPRLYQQKIYDKITRDNRAKICEELAIMELAEVDDIKEYAKKKYAQIEERYRKHNKNLISKEYGQNTISNQLQTFGRNSNAYHRENTDDSESGSNNY